MLRVSNNELLRYFLLWNFLSSSTASDDCIIPNGFTPVPFKITDLENRCPDFRRNCTIPDWAWKEVAEIVIPERLPPLIKVMSEFEKKQKDIVLLTVNYAYSSLFVNWVCSVTRLGLDPTKFTLVVVVEEKSRKLVDRMGFRYVAVKDWLRTRTIKGTSSGFGAGDYKWIAAILNIYLTDLMDIGYNVLMQDVDITWNRNPMPYLNENREFDILLVEDQKRKFHSEIRPKNVDKQRNGGFLYYRSTCRTLVYTKTLRNCIVHIIWRRSDQVLMNRLIDNHRFKGIQVGYLPSNLFLNGNRWKPWEIPSKRPLPYNPFTFHSSWTTGLDDKILKFLTVGQWFTTCKFFEPELVPKINLTKQFTQYKRNYRKIKDWHYVAQMLISNLFKPKWDMSSAQEDPPKPELDIWAGTWTPKELSS